MNPEEKLSRVLDDWETGFEPDPTLSHSVWKRIERAENERHARQNAGRFLNWLRDLLASPAYAAGFASLFVALGIGGTYIAQTAFNQQPKELTINYRLSIDPLYRLESIEGTPASHVAANDPGENQALFDTLTWLKVELDLNSRQFDSIAKLHTRYEDSFEHVFSELVATRKSFMEIDRKRMSSDVIDYLSLYELLQEQKSLRERSSQLTEELIEKVSQVITPEQQARFEKLLKRIAPPSEASHSSRNA